METPSADPLVARARELAIRLHDEAKQTRSDGAPYWTHPQRVAATLEKHGLPPAVVAAAWLHDVPEDCTPDLAGCEAMLARIAGEFGPDVASLVREVTNFATPDETMEQKQARLREHAKHMSPHAKWIKLADRLDNVSGMQGWADSKKRRYADATMLLLAALKPLPPGSESTAAAIEAAARAVSQ
jgi:(p)ppGpp synthase/HD superfamily hydrolase